MGLGSLSLQTFSHLPKGLISPSSLMKKTISLNKENVLIEVLCYSQGDGRPFWKLVVSEATGCADDDYFEEVYEVISLKTNPFKVLVLRPVLTLK